MSTADFFALNPGYNRPVMPPQSTLVIPDDRLDKFTRELRRHAGPFSNWGIYSLKRGEDLTKVAAQLSMNPEDLKRVNGIVDEGQPALALLVPLDEKASLAGVEKLDDKAFSVLARQKNQPVATRVHMVQRGETLGGIAHRYRVSLAELKRINRLKGSQIRAGSRLVIREQRATHAHGQHPALFPLASATQNLLARAEEMEAAELDEDDLP
jgi:membrane-bound lytic murein transglycosylase D